MLKLLLLVLLLLPIASGQDLETCSSGICPTDPDTGKIKCPTLNPSYPAEPYFDAYVVAMPEVTFVSFSDYNDPNELNNTLLMNISFNNSTLANFTLSILSL